MPDTCGDNVVNAGTTEYFSHKPRIFSAAAGDQGCRLLALSRASFDQLQTRHPQASLLMPGFWLGVLPDLFSITRKARAAACWHLAEP